MQQVPHRADIHQPSLTAMIGDRVHEITAASLSRSLPDPLAAEGLTAASGDLVAISGDDVSQLVPTPWDPGTLWPPVPQTPVSLALDTGAGPVSLLAGGRVTDAAGGSGERAVALEVTDAYESLNKTISWDGVSAAMPHAEEATTARYVGMLTTAITDTLLRYCGWFTTPPELGYNVLSVPAQGSLWPIKGTVTEAGRAGGGFPYWSSAPWGILAVDAIANYRLAAQYTIKQRGHLELVALTRTSTNDGNFELSIIMGDSGVKISWTDNFANVHVKDNATSGWRTVAFVTRGNDLLYATLSYVSDTEVDVTLRAGSNRTTERVTVPAAITTVASTTARIAGTGRGGGFQVSYPSTPHTLEGWRPNAVLYPRTLQRNSLVVRPPIESEKVADLLADQCKAEGSTYWIDETGVLRFWDLKRLEEQPSVATITSADDILETGFEWAQADPAVHSRVLVKWRECISGRAWRTNVDLWQGSGTTISPGDAPAEAPIEEWITVPDDEVWIMPDLSFSRVGTVTGDEFNYGWGSWYGAVLDDTDGWAYGTGPGAGSFLVSIERVTDRAFKLRTIWTGSGNAIQRTPSPGVQTELWRIRRDFNLPILRGKARYEFMDRTLYSAQQGPAGAPEHVIDGGWWIQTEDQAAYIADYAAARMTIPQPVLSEIPIRPMPGLQIGDVVEARDEHRTRLTIRGIVCADSKAIESTEDRLRMKHSISIRPTYVTRNGVTWLDWATAARPKTTAQWATNQGGTWAGWGANPLLKEQV